MRVRVVLLGLAAVATAKLPRGVDPALAAHYQEGSEFECLDGSKRIPYSQVNDDYCDCADGSDEPGTSACNNGTFYCENRGHLPGHLEAGRVNDGVCDYDVCCDGSDEWGTDAGCSNRCEELGAEHRRTAAEEAQRNTEGQQRLAALVAEARVERVKKAEELQRLNGALDEAEAMLASASGRKEAEEQRAREATTQMQALERELLPDAVQLRKTLAAELHVLRARRDALILLLRGVREDHNREFSDDAVAAALAAYAEWIERLPYMEEAALEYAGEAQEAREAREGEMDRDAEAADDAALPACVEAVRVARSERETLDEDIGALLEMLGGLRDGYNRNYHDLAVKSAVVGLGDWEDAQKREDSDLEAARTEAGFDVLAERVKEAEQRLAESTPAADEPQDEGESALEAARREFREAQQEKNRVAGEAETLRVLLEETDLGPQAMYLPVNSECHELDAGEYRYEVCLLDRVTQIDSKNGARVGLGSFDGFGDSGHSVLRYTRGTKCWNGPERSITVAFECAPEIRILSVSELEKCEYQARMTGPFACELPADQEEIATAQADQEETSQEETTAAEADQRHDEL
ncbi:hypothetical protein GGF46_000224 [Coemansia sp. RSA 552]|nr:hypothetical protein GGF46_000224 [Coemansia sp. RSA 552]